MGSEGRNGANAHGGAAAAARAGGSGVARGHRSTSPTFAFVGAGGDDDEWGFGDSDGPDDDADASGGLGTTTSARSTAAAGGGDSNVPPPVPARPDAREKQAESTPSPLSDTSHVWAWGDPWLRDSDLGMVGLHNLGNTCFMNAVIQCLSFARPLTAFVLQGRCDKERSGASRAKVAVAAEFAALIRSLWDPSGPHAVSPRRFKLQIGKFAPRFVGYEQQDAHEFLRFLLDGLHSELNRVRSPPPYAPHPDSLSRRSVSEQLVYHVAWHRARDDSPVLDVFGGLLWSTLRCGACGHVSHAWDPFCDVSLEIPPGASSLADLLDDFARDEPLDGDEKPVCEGCKQRARSTKRILFQKLPEVLVVHLKRFSFATYRGRKISTNISFPRDGLDLGPFCADTADKPSSYRLVAVAMHTGSLLSGHYTAICRHPARPSRWVLFNDSLVRVVSEADVGGSGAYILLYERVRPR